MWYSLAQPVLLFATHVKEFIRRDKAEIAAYIHSVSFRAVSPSQPTGTATSFKHLQGAPVAALWKKICSNMEREMYFLEGKKTSQTHPLTVISLEKTVLCNMISLLGKTIFRFNLKPG